MRCVVYIDDLLLVLQNKEKAERILSNSLSSLGFLINYPKSVFGPTQTLVRQ